jgi:coenzyme F420-0:L-glutamate ligase/coenzyme F420-1:gamma-L-glutamate ligase
VTVEITPIHGIGEIEPGADLAGIIVAALHAAGFVLLDGDVLVVTHKAVSKAEEAVARFDDDEDQRRAIIASEAAAILRRRGDLVITETHHGFICANAGVDRSNMPRGFLALLPRDPDRSAQKLRTKIRRAAGAEIAVVITDTFGRPWRKGLTDVAIGVAGMPALVDYRGTTDTFGRALTVTEVALVDEVAAAADLVMGKAKGVPLAVVRGLEYPAGEGRATDLVRSADEDMFR